jgi:hypothetical protein
MVGMMGNSVGAPAWSNASPPWESPESPDSSTLLRRVAFRQSTTRNDSRSVTEDDMTINAIAGTPATRASEGCGPGTQPSALTEKLMWSATSAIGQSTPSDSEGDAPTNGRLVDEYA